MVAVLANLLQVSIPEKEQNWGFVAIWMTKEYIEERKNIFAGKFDGRSTGCFVKQISISQKERNWGIRGNFYDE